MKQHPTTEALLAYPMGELERETARSVFEHCNSCPECGAELAMIIRLRSTVVGSERRYGRTWSWLAIAASLVVLIAAGAFFANLVGHRFRPVNDASSGAASAEPALASLATQETIPRGFFELRFGGLVPVDTGERLLQQGLEALVEERFEEADQVLSRRLASSPRDIEASTYLGIARYLQGGCVPSPVEKSWRSLGWVGVPRLMGSRQS